MRGADKGADKAAAPKREKRAKSRKESIGGGGQSDALRLLEQQFYQQFAVPGAAGERDGESEPPAGDDAEAIEDEHRGGESEEEGFYEDSTDDAGTDAASPNAAGSVPSDDSGGDEFDEDILGEGPPEDLPQAGTSGTHEKEQSAGATAGRPRRVPETVVFSDPTTSYQVPKSHRKQFMSSKIQEINRDPIERAQESARSGEDDEEDQWANDRKLSELLSTTLFAPGAANDTGKKRKLNTTTNETLARVLELSNSDTLHAPGRAGSGWGATQLRAQELGRMPGAMRAGMRRAAGERRARELETQKELGLWHPSLHRKQQQNRATATERGAKPTQPKKRLRGIGSGIGKFRGGTLHLSDKDVQRIKSQGSRK